MSYSQHETQTAGTVDRAAQGRNASAPFVIISRETGIRQVVGVVLLRDDGAALLQHRDNISTISDPGLWVFPGGHLQSHETPREGAVREMEEETCYRCNNLCLLTRLAIEERELLFFWENYDGKQHVACREGQALEFVDRQKVESLPKRSYVTEVFDLALAAQSSSNVAIGNTNKSSNK